MKRPKEREERKSNAADFTLVIKESQNLAEAAFVIDPLPFFTTKFFGGGILRRKLELEIRLKNYFGEKSY